VRTSKKTGVSRDFPTQPRFSTGVDILWTDVPATRLLEGFSSDSVLWTTWWNEGFGGVRRSVYTAPDSGDGRRRTNPF
jgi:hypothetical protein